ncbi:MAG: alpha/beta hydrolase, partial [Chloroflexi bacterium]|nr:alpha/beta hydrolase [Chloroflexota bacterium]
MVGQVDEVQRDRWVANEIDLGRARFIAQGTDANDVERTLGRISRAEDWCREWSATGDMHQVLASEAEKSGRTISAGEAYIMAALAYHWGKMRWQLVLKDEAQYHQAHQKSIEAFWKGLQYLDSTAERVEIPYEEINMPAYLRKPKGVSRAPVVL